MLSSVEEERKGLVLRRRHPWRTLNRNLMDKDESSLRQTDDDALSEFNSVFSAGLLGWTSP